MIGGPVGDAGLTGQNHRRHVWRHGVTAAVRSQVKIHQKLTAAAYAGRYVAKKYRSSRTGGAL